MPTKLVCRECYRVLEADEEICPVCGSESLSDDWAGYVVIIDPEESEIAEKMGVDREGKYALKVR